MKIHFNKKFYLFAAICLILILLPYDNCIPIFAQSQSESEVKTLTVAFPDAPGYSQTRADGTRYGLVVDYLNEIAKYTNWEYEYIDIPDNTSMERFKAGEFDLIGGVYYSPVLEEYFAYPDFTTGYSRAYLMADKNDYSLKTYDLNSLNGKTIGIYENATENIRRLENFLTANNIECNLKFYTFDQLDEDGTVFSYLEKGEIDLALCSIIDPSLPYKVITYFDSQPHYIVTYAGNEEILAELNMALEKILDSNPNFAHECFDKNFSTSTKGDTQFTQHELDYIKEHPEITVALPKSWHPMCCLDSDDQLHNGIVPDILDNISSYSGLKFEYKFTSNYNEAIELVQNGNADMLGFFLDSEEESHKKGLVLSSSYATMNNILLVNNASEYPGNNIRCALIDGRTLPSNIYAKEFIYYDSVNAALEAVNNGEVDMFYGLSSRLESAFQNCRSINITPLTIANNSSNICFAIKQPADTTLLTILNKSVNHISQTEKDAIMQQNLISIGVNNFSLSTFLYNQPVLFISIVTIVVILIVISVILFARSRIRTAVMQANLERAQAENQAKGDFLSRMSHEIRTPMNAIVGLADLTTKMDNVPDDVRDNLNKINASSRYMLNLISNILDMSRIENGMLNITVELFSLKKVIDELNDMMTSEAKRRNIRFIKNISYEHEYFMGDALRLQQVLMNLVTNAFKFTPAKGTVTLTLHENYLSDTHSSIYVCVKDTGIGIPANEHERIFETFEQLGPSQSKIQGTGLGLPICNNIVKLMEGKLEVKSSPNAGSEFFFTIPLPHCEPPCEEELTIEDGVLSGMHILLVEDNDLNAEVATKLLEFQAATVERVENGKQAVELFNSRRPETFFAILMDIRMPIMNGIDATKAIRALPRNDASKIPIIAMTANAFETECSDALDAGMNEFITKPIDLNRLCNVLLSYK